MTGNFMLDVSDGIINAWLKRGCAQLHVLKTDIYDKKIWISSQQSQQYFTFVT